MGRTNIASGGYTAVQAGRVTGKSTKPAKEAKGDKEAPESKDGARVVNVQSGNATVGVVADVVEGNINVSFF